MEGIQSSGSKFKYYYEQKRKINEIMDFVNDKLDKAYLKDLDKLVLEEVYSLSKCIKLLDELEMHMDILRHIQRETINKKHYKPTKAIKHDN